MIERGLVGGLGHAHAAGRDVDAPRLQPAQHLGEAAPLDAAHQILGRDDTVFEEQLDRVHAFVAQLAQRFAHAEAGVGFFQDEARHPAVARLRARVGDGQQRERVALAAVGDEHLAAIDDIVIAVAPRGGADGLHVGARVRFGQRQPAARLAGGEARQEAAALGVGAVVEHGQRGHGVAVEHAGQRHPAAAQLLDHAGVGADVEAEPPVLRRHQRAEEPERAHAGDESVRIGVGVLERGGDRPDLVVHEAPDVGDDRRSHREGIVQ